ncbi:LuxR C-terminal-related transcriptional regulator [Rhizobium sp. SG2393]|uniref:response regulator transcription factor n=1 Tax=Rhizobium sp. SG2393 TaxID=3276279 RepID=UPI003671C72B
MRQSQAELDGLSDVIGSIYDTVLDETLWPQTLQMICAYTGGRASRIYWRDASNGIGETVYSWGIDPEFIRLYREKFVTLNPTYPASIFIKPGEVFASSQLVAHDAFQASRFFREWAAPQGFFDAAIFNIQRYEASAAAFTVITGDQYGLVDERLRTRLRRLVPHIQRATLIRREIGRQEKRVRSLESALNHVEAAVFILGPDGVATWTNQSAQTLLARGDVVREGAQGLGLVDPEAQRLLRDALAGGTAQRDVLLHSYPALIKMTDAEGADWIAYLMRLEPNSSTQAAFEQVGRSARAALFIRRAEAVPASGIEACAVLYGLTPGEMRVLHAAVQTHTVAEMAATLDISPNTVKKHLQAIFAKMGVSRRAAMIRAVLAARQ